MPPIGSRYTRFSVMKHLLGIFLAFCAHQSLADGLVEAEGVNLVRGHCSACHSLSIVTSQRGDREYWLGLIRWMQETQNLWELGEAEAVIIDYLVENYPIVEKGRRAPLAPVEWYDFKD